jgi:hypothetical protein
MSPSVFSLLLFVALAQARPGPPSGPDLCNTRLLAQANLMAAKIEPANLSQPIRRRAGNLIPGSTATSVYRNCLPTVSGGVEGMVAILERCEKCIPSPGLATAAAATPCPQGCCASFLPDVMQVVVCGTGLGCMRAFGKTRLQLWAWEAADGFTGADKAVCDRLVDDRGLGQRCALRFGVDDSGYVQLAPCPAGATGAGFVVPSASTALAGAAICAPVPALDAAPDPADDGDPMRRAGSGAPATGAQSVKGGRVLKRSVPVDGGAGRGETVDEQVDASPDTSPEDGEAAASPEASAEAAPPGDETPRETSFD